MKCKKCGKNYEDNNNFCTKCGIALSDKGSNWFSKLNNQAKAVIIVISVVVIGIFGYLIYENVLFNNRKQEMQESRMEKALEEYANTPVTSDLRIMNWTKHRSGDYIYINGTVRNISSKTIRYFRIDAKFLDSQGNIIDSDYTNDGQELEPNESREFDMMHKYNYRIDDIRLSVSEVN